MLYTHWHRKIFVLNLCCVYVPRDSSSGAPWQTGIQCLGKWARKVYKTKLKIGKRAFYFIFFVGFFI